MGDGVRRLGRGRIRLGGDRHATTDERKRVLQLRYLALPDCGMYRQAYVVGAFTMVAGESASRRLCTAIKVRYPIAEARGLGSHSEQAWT